MKEQVLSALKPLGEVSITTISEAFEASPDIIVRGIIKQASAEAVFSFTHPTLRFSFNGPMSGTNNDYGFYAYVPNPSAQQAQEPQQTQQEKPPKPSSK